MFCISHLSLNWFKKGYFAYAMSLGQMHLTLLGPRDASCKQRKPNQDVHLSVSLWQ